MNPFEQITGLKITFSCIFRIIQGMIHYNERIVFGSYQNILENVQVGIQICAVMVKKDFLIGKGGKGMLELGSSQLSMKNRSLA